MGPLKSISLLSQKGSSPHPRAKLVKVAAPLTLRFAEKTKTESLSLDSNEKRKALMHRLRQKIYLLSARCPRYLVVYATIVTDESRASPASFVGIAARDSLGLLGLMFLRKARWLGVLL